jgi:hypothetical protein
MHVAIAVDRVVYHAKGSRREETINTRVYTKICNEWGTWNTIYTGNN